LLQAFNIFISPRKEYRGRVRARPRSIVATKLIRPWVDPDPQNNTGGQVTPGGVGGWAAGNQADPWVDDTVSQ